MNLTKRVKKLFFKQKEYYFSRYYYRQLIDKYTTNIATYVKLLNATSLAVYNQNTNKNILEDSTVTFKYTISQTKKIYGEPIYIIENHVINEMSILFYRLKFANERVKCEFHFYKNELFYIKYIFSYISDKQKKSIINVLEGKYLEGKKFNYKMNIISDNNNNKLLITEDSHFNIDYLSLNSDFFYSIEDLKKQNEEKQIESQLKFINQMAKNL